MTGSRRDQHAWRQRAPGRTRTAALALAVAAALGAPNAPVGVPRHACAQQAPTGEGTDVRRRLSDVVKDREQAAVRAAERSARAGDLTEEVRALDARLLSAARKREALREEEEALEEEYELHLERIELIQSEYERARHLLSQRLTSIYKRGRLGNNRALLQAAASSEPLRMARYLAAVSRTDTSALDDYETVRRRHELAIRELDAKKQSIASKNASFEQEQSRYEQAREEKTILLARMEKDSQVDRSRREELLAVEAELRAIIEASSAPPELEADEARAGDEPDDAAAADDDGEAAVESPTNRQRPSFHSRANRRRRNKPREDFADRKGRLAAPVHGKVLSRYGEKRSSGRVVQGVLVRAGNDTQVASVGGGEIVFSGPFPGLGKTIIINHGDRYHSVYAQLDVLQHEVGERVRENQVVGSLSRTEPVLHFELRAEGKAVDPAGWLDGGYDAFGR